MAKRDIPTFDLRTDMPRPTWCDGLCIVGAVVLFAGMVAYGGWRAYVALGSLLGVTG